GNDRHLQPFQKLNNVPAVTAAENSEFMLQDHSVEIAGIQIISCFYIRGYLVLLDLKFNIRRVVVCFQPVVYCNYRYGCSITSDAFKQIFCKGGYPTFSRWEIADQCNFVHVSVLGF